MRARPIAATAWTRARAATFDTIIATNVKKNDCDDVFRIGDSECVDADRHEEEIVGERRHDARGERRPQTEGDRNDDDRGQEHQGDILDINPWLKQLSNDNRTADGDESEQT